MSFKLAAFFAMSWGLMAILGALMVLSSSPAADDPTRQMVNAFGNPSTTSINDPKLGEDDETGIVSGVFDMAGVAKDWVVFMANAASLNFEFFQGDLVVVRFVFLLMASPFMFVVALALAQTLTGMFRGLAGFIPGISDARLKTNVQPAPEAMPRVRQLQAVVFDWQASGKHDYGLLAQKVRPIMPEAVGKWPLLGWYYIRWHVLCILLLQSVREMDEQSGALTEIVRELDHDASDLSE